MTFVSKHGFTPDFSPQNDLSSASHDPQEQDSLAAKRIVTYREEMIRLISLLGNSKVFGKELVEEGRGILEDLLKAHAAFKYEAHPYKNAPMLPSYKKAFGMIKSLAIPATITSEQERQILQEVLPPVELESSFLVKNFKPLLVGGTTLIFGIFGAFLLLRT